MLTERQLADLLRATGEAHHRTFAATNGEDAEWPRWYADYLAPRLAAALSRPVSTTDLAADLRALDASHRSAPPQPWPEFYARSLLPKLSAL